MSEAGITPAVDPSTGVSTHHFSWSSRCHLGLTNENLREANESIRLEPLYSGIAQMSHYCVRLTKDFAIMTGNNQEWLDNVHFSWKFLGYSQTN